MISKIQFTVTGDPRPKGRPRLGKYGNVFTPKKTREAEEAFLKQALKYRPKKPSPNPIKLDLLFVKKKVYKSKKDKHGLRSKVYADRRPDMDNYEKLVIDAMNEWFWLDDAQVVEVHIKKIYGKEPRTEVMIEELEDLEELEDVI